MVIERTLELATMLVLAGTLPLAVVAVRGFRGAPFESVLRPLPVVIVAYVAMNAPAVVGVSAPPTFYLATSTVGVLGALVSAGHALVLLTERRKL